MKWLVAKKRKTAAHNYNKAITFRYVQDWTLMRFKFLMISITKCLIGKKSLKHTQFCQILSKMKMSNNPVKYEVLIKQYLRSILDMSGIVHYVI